MDYTVLIVDDEEEIRRTLSGYLNLSGFHVLAAADAYEALEIVRRGKVHLVLCDIKMPGMNGIELLERIREFDFSIQVVMMTGFSTFDITLQALERGAADYVLKPFENLEQIVELLHISADRLTRWRKALAGSAKRGNATGPEKG